MIDFSESEEGRRREKHPLLPPTGTPTRGWTRDSRYAPGGEWNLPLFGVGAGAPADCAIGPGSPVRASGTCAMSRLPRPGASRRWRTSVGGHVPEKAFTRGREGDGGGEKGYGTFWGLKRRKRSPFVPSSPCGKSSTPVGQPPLQWP